MSALLSILQILIGLSLLALFLLLFAVILVTWAWAQEESTGEQAREIGLGEVLSTAAIEWGIYVILLAYALRPPKVFHEAPPLHEAFVQGRPSAGAARQIPIIFVPSLHSGAFIFSPLKWRLRQNFYVSLWPFSFRPFLNSAALLEDDLEIFIKRTLKETQSPYFRLISFGSSRPLVEHVLAKGYRASCLNWVCIAGAEALSAPLRFLHTQRLRAVYDRPHPSPRIHPDLLVHGSHDIFCYPASVFGSAHKHIHVPTAGHYSLLQNPKMIQPVLDLFAEEHA